MQHGLTAVVAERLGPCGRGRTTSAAGGAGRRPALSCQAVRRVVRTPVVCQVSKSAVRCLRWLAGVRCEPPQADEASPAVPTPPVCGWRARRRGRGPRHRACSRRGGRKVGGEERPELGEALPTARAHETLGADCGAALGEHRLKEAVDEGFGGERQPFPARARTFFVAERDLPVFQRFQPVVGEGNAVDIRRKGGEDLAPTPRRLAVSHPVLVPHLGRYMLGKTGRRQDRAALAPEKTREGTDRHEPGGGTR